MKRLLIVWLLALVSLGYSQEDTILRQYNLAYNSLEASVDALAEGNSVAAREQLDGLENTLRVLQPETASTNIVGALNNTIGLAQTSIQNRSQTDLSVQVAVLEGGFWRLVYESAISAADQGDVATAKARLLQIATDMGLPQETLDAIGATSADAAGAPLAMLTLLEQGVTSEVSTKLALSEELAATDRDSSYIQLAEAYSLFIPVQDSPRAVGNETDTFEEAFALIAEAESVDTESFATKIAELNVQMNQFAQAASAGLSTPVEGAVVAPPAGTEAEADPLTDNAVAAETDALETDDAVEAAPLNSVNADLVDTATNEGLTPPSDTLTATEAATPDTTAATPTPPTVPDTSVANTSVPDTSVPDTSVPDTSELERELGTYNLTRNNRNNVVDAYSDAGFDSVESMLNTLYAQSARIIAAVETGNQDRAKTLLTDMDELYTDYAAPLMSNNVSFDNSMQSLLSTLRASPVLRLQDAAVLSGHVEALDMTLNGGSVPALHDAIVTTTNVWAGWVRTIVVILLALLALFPLYLLRLAFGGGNRNWQLIGGALFFLLFPLMFEGLSHLATLISQASGGVAPLDTFASFSIFQNEISQVIWALLSALAIGLATAGLYGICVQFGLLGRRTASAQASNLETSVGNTAINTSFDWDEEF